MIYLINFLRKLVFCCVAMVLFGLQANSQGETLTNYDLVYTDGGASKLFDVDSGKTIEFSPNNEFQLYSIAPNEKFALVSRENAKDCIINQQWEIQGCLDRWLQGEVVQWSADSQAVWSSDESGILHQFNLLGIETFTFDPRAEFPEIFVGSRSRDLVERIAIDPMYGKVAFVHLKVNQFADLYIVDSPTKQILHHIHGGNDGMAFSPDGTQFTYLKGCLSPSCSYSNKLSILDILTGDILETEIQVDGNPTSPRSKPYWSPDGTQIAFWVSWVTDANFPHAVVIYEVGTQQISFVSYSQSQNSVQHFLRWSPDSRWLLKMSQNPSELSVLNMATLEDQILIPLGENLGYRDPLWIPKGWGQN